MNQTRSFEISGKVITKDDVRRMSEVLLREISDSQQRQANARVSFSIYCSDRTTYESQTNDIFLNDQTIDLKKANRIRMRFDDYAAGRSIEISIARGEGKWSDNLGVVSGDDEDWVIGRFTKLREIVASFTPQSQLFSKMKGLLIPFDALIMTLSAVRIIIYCVMFLPPPPQDNLSQAVSVFLLYGSTAFMFVFTFMPISIWMNNYLEKLWPDIEFDFGPEHTRREKRIRSVVYGALTLVLIPLATSGIYGLISGK